LQLFEPGYNLGMSSRSFSRLCAALLARLKHAGDIPSGQWRASRIKGPWRLIVNGCRCATCDHKLRLSRRLTGRSPSQLTPPEKHLNLIPFLSLFSTREVP
jgi:hypothetical protein